MPRLFQPDTSAGQRRLLVERSSPRLRGYDKLWDRKAKRYRKEHPFCARCAQFGRLRMGDVLDHKFPVQDGGKVHCEEAGVWHLCNPCHAEKTRWEAYARAMGQMERIVEWCDNPDVRPRLRGDLDGTIV